MKKLYFFIFKKFLRSIGFNSNNYKLKLNLSAPVIHKVNRSRFLRIISLTLLILISLLTSCNTTEPPNNQSLSLKLEDVSCTEAWVQLTTNKIQLPAVINLIKTDASGNSKDVKFYVSTEDTLLNIDSLLPNQNYTFQASSIQNQVSSISSNKVTATTLDTTSHNFIWQTFEFGVNTYQSHLFDVAIIDENNIWAVGEIYILDSLGKPDPNAYNAVHWNGSDWELKRINMQSSCNPVTYPPLKAIWAFSANNITVTSGGSIGWFDGNTNRADCGIRSILTGSINKLWGSSSNDLYAVGSNGNIAHYQNGSWIKIESGTNLSLSDISVNKLGEIFIGGGNPSFAQGIILKSVNDNNFTIFAEGANITETQLFNPNLYGSISSIWLDQNNTLYSAGNILFQYKFNKWSYVKSLSENFIGGNQGAFYRGYITKIRGNASNDMWIVGDRNTARHFNGTSWQQVGMPYDPQVDLVWRGISCKNNNIVIVGTHDRSAIIMMIKE